MAYFPGFRFMRYAGDSLVDMAVAQPAKTYKGVKHKSPHAPSDGSLRGFMFYENSQ